MSANLTDCAANGGDTISRQRGCINDEQRECVKCHHCIVWDITESRFWGFRANCPYMEEIKSKEKKR